MYKCVYCDKETTRLAEINGKMVYVCPDSACDLYYMAEQDGIITGANTPEKENNKKVEVKQ